MELSTLGTPSLGRRAVISFLDSISAFVVTVVAAEVPAGGMGGMKDAAVEECMVLVGETGRRARDRDCARASRFTGPDRADGDCLGSDTRYSGDDVDPAGGQATWIQRRTRGV